jgi:superfamily II DNA helicase RecQ
VKDAGRAADDRAQRRREEVREIIEQLGLRRPDIFYHGIDRPNLRYSRKLTAGKRSGVAAAVKQENKQESFTAPIKTSIWWQAYWA